MAWVGQPWATLGQPWAARQKRGEEKKEMVMDVSDVNSDEEDDDVKDDVGVDGDGGVMNWGWW